jgi:hypothetical protein
VGPAETHRVHCSLSRLIVLSPDFSSPVHLQKRSTSERRERPLLAKGWMMSEKWPTKFSLTNTTSTYLYGSLTCRKSTTWDRRLYFSSEGRHVEDFFARKIRRFRPGLNPWYWVPEAGMLTTRPPKPFQ